MLRLIENKLCNGNIAYWASSLSVGNKSQDNLGIGFEIPRCKPKTANKIEEIFELLRRVIQLDLAELILLVFF